MRVIQTPATPRNALILPYKKEEIACSIGHRPLLIFLQMLLFAGVTKGPGYALRCPFGLLFWILAKNIEGAQPAVADTPEEEIERQLRIRRAERGE